MIEAIKVTKKGKLRDLSELAQGDNLDFIGKTEREVVLGVYNNQYFTRIGTMIMLSIPGRELQIVYQHYLATQEMLKEGILEPCGNVSIAPCEEYPEHEQICKKYLIRQTAEVVA